jgi:hypothetical protein
MSATGVSWSNPSCPCLGSLAAFGYTGNLIANIDSRRFDYGRSYGLRECLAHDTGLPPFCDKGDPPAWCLDPWCYVDPDDCEESIKVAKSSYFTGVSYSADACGATDYSFLGWYIANGTIGAPCSTSSECFGPQVICNPFTFKCACREAWAVRGDHCNILTPRSAWAIGAVGVSLVLYLVCFGFLITQLVRVTQLVRFAHLPERQGAPSSRCSSFKAIGHALCSRATWRAWWSVLSVPAAWTVMSVALMTANMLHRLFSILGMVSDKVHFDVFNNVTESCATATSLPPAALAPAQPCWTPAH